MDSSSNSVQCFRRVNETESLRSGSLLPSVLKDHSRMAYSRCNRVLVLRPITERP